MIGEDFIIIGRRISPLAYIKLSLKIRSGLIRDGNRIIKYTYKFKYLIIDKVK